MYFAGGTGAFRARLCGDQKKNDVFFCAPAWDDILQKGGGAG